MKMKICIMMMILAEIYLSHDISLENPYQEISKDNFSEISSKDNPKETFFGNSDHEIKPNLHKYSVNQIDYERKVSQNIPQISVRKAISKSGDNESHFQSQLVNKNLSKSVSHSGQELVNSSCKVLQDSENEKKLSPQGPFDSQDEDCQVQLDSTFILEEHSSENNSCLGSCSDCNDEYEMDLTNNYESLTSLLISKVRIISIQQQNWKVFKMIVNLTI